MKKEKWQVFLIGILCFVTAASICVQYRSAISYTTEGEATVQSIAENKLRDQVLTEQENYNRLYVQVQLAQTQLENLRKSSASNSEESEKLEKELTEYNRLLGYTDVTGKGIVITLQDSDSTGDLIHYIDLVEVVNELFNQGADAVSINNQRIVSTTAISCNGNVVKINNEKVSVPFVIKAIGSPTELYSTMLRPNAYLDFMKNDGIRVKVEKKDSITVPKYTGTRQYKYLRVVE